MPLINLFLQKRRMHENQHGFFMVAIAYVISVLMLFMGSDIFYNINSSAAGIGMDTNEETQIVTQDELTNLLTADLLVGQTQSKLVSPYGLSEATGTGLGKTPIKVGAYLEDDFWLLGSSMKTEEFDSIMEKISLGSADEDVAALSEKASGKTEASTSAKVSKLKIAAASKTDHTSSTEEIKSLSTEETVNYAAISVTEDEVNMLEHIVEAEATGEDMEGKILIANVIFNRIASNQFPDSVEHVIFQKVNDDYQFSPVADERYWSVKITDETEEAVERALQGEDYSEGALYFISRKRTNSENAKWFDRNLDWLFKHGGHEFYK